MKLDYGYTTSTTSEPPAYPNKFINGNIHVVTAASIPNAKSIEGAVQWDTVNYAYDQMVVNRRGLGILGFAVRSETDQRRNIRTRYEYHQSYPVVGIVRRVLSETKKPDGSTVINSESLHDYAVEPRGSLADPSVVPHMQGAPYRIHKIGDTTDIYDYVTGDLISQVSNTYNESNSGVQDSSAFDNYEYGKPKIITTVTTDKTNDLTWTKKTTNTFEHRLVGKYQIGLLKTSKVEHSTTDPSAPDTITKESSFTYYPVGHINEGQLQEEIIEPNKTSKEERSNYLKTTHTYDDKGLKTGTSAEGYDHNGDPLPTRETSIKTEFVPGTETLAMVRRETVTNALGHEMMVEKSLEHGKTVYSEDVNNVHTITSYDRWGSKPETQVLGGVTSSVTEHYWEVSVGDALPGTFSKRVVKFTVDEGAAAPDKVEYFDANGQVLRSVSRSFTERDIFFDSVHDVLGRRTSQTAAYFRGDIAYLKSTWKYLDNTSRVEKEVSLDGTENNYSYSKHTMTRTSDERVHIESRHATGNIFKVEEGSEADQSKRTSIAYTYDAGFKWDTHCSGIMNIISHDIQ